jgi:hypothetical protein
MQLNDEASDEERQLLLPFVTRLACTDTWEVEMEHEAYMPARLPWRQSFPDRLAILEAALAIGRQADGLAPEEVRTRLESVPCGANTLTSVDEHSPLSIVQGWLAGVI